MQAKFMPPKRVCLQLENFALILGFNVFLKTDDFREGPEGAMALSDFCLAPGLPPSLNELV